MRRLLKWLAVVIVVVIVPAAVLVGIAIYDKSTRPDADPDRDVGETIVVRTEKQPGEQGWGIVLARVLSKRLGTPIRWNIYEQPAGASYDLKKPSVVVHSSTEPRLKWVKSRHLEVCTTPSADIWQWHYGPNSATSSNIGGADSGIFYFKEANGAIRFTVTVIKKC